MKHLIEGFGKTSKIVDRKYTFQELLTLCSDLHFEELEISFDLTIILYHEKCLYPSIISYT